MQSLLPPTFRPADPLALSSGAGARLVLAAVVLALVWAGVAWAMRG